MVGSGGIGGSSDFGSAGKAGHAILEMQGFVQAIGEQRFGENQFNVTLYGGNGGTGDVSFSRKTDGADGGHAVVHAPDLPTFVTRGKSIWNYNLVGGQGGAAIGAGNTGNGGKGGSAVITSPITFDNRLDNDGSPAVVIASIAARLEGGKGGDAHKRTDTTDRADGVAGDGATAAFINNVKIENNLQFGINLTAIGGDGGAGNFNGNGGQAIIRLDEAAGPRDPSISTQINPLNSVNVAANGGNAGDFNSLNSSSTGGAAWASIVQTSDSNLTVGVESTGGIGNRGASGNSFARAKATTNVALNAPNSGPTTIADAQALAADLTGLNYLPTIGTSATADAKAESNTSSGQVRANAVAVSGFGSEESGAANAFSRAQQTGHGDSFANSFSYAARDDNAASANYATSRATSLSEENADAIAVAVSNGSFNKNHAVARASGAFSSRSFSEIRSSSTDYAHTANIKNETSFTGAYFARPALDSSSYFGFQQSEFESTENMEIATHVLVAPDQTVADQMVTDQSTFADVFVDDLDAEILGIGHMGGGYLAATSALPGTMISTSDFDLSLELQNQDKSMMMGLFGLEQEGEGFDEMSLSIAFNNQVVVDETFASLSEANLFFDDALFNLGELAGLDSTVNFEFDLSMRDSNADNAFTFGFVFGHADPRGQVEFFSASAFDGTGGLAGFSSVPEPTSGSLICLIGLTALMKRRRNCNVT